MTREIDRSLPPRLNASSGASRGSEVAFESATLPSGSPAAATACRRRCCSALPMTATTALRLGPPGPASPGGCCCASTRRAKSFSSPGVTCCKCVTCDTEGSGAAGGFYCKAIEGEALERDVKWVLKGEVDARKGRRERPGHQVMRGIRGPPLCYTSASCRSNKRVPHDTSFHQRWCSSESFLGFSSLLLLSSLTALKGGGAQEG